MSTGFIVFRLLYELAVGGAALFVSGDNWVGV